MSNVPPNPGDIQPSDQDPALAVDIDAGVRVKGGVKFTHRQVLGSLAAMGALGVALGSLLARLL
jgi:hypothetical protein